MLCRLPLLRALVPPPGSRWHADGLGGLRRGEPCGAELVVLPAPCGGACLECLAALAAAAGLAGVEEVGGGEPAVVRFELGALGGGYAGGVAPGVGAVEARPGRV